MDVWLNELANKSMVSEWWAVLEARCGELVTSSFTQPLRAEEGDA